MSFALSTVALAGSVLALPKPCPGGWVWIAAGAGGVIAVFPLFLAPGAFLILGGILDLELGKPFFPMPVRAEPSEQSELKIA